MKKNLRLYIIGFTLSIFLTAGAFASVFFNLLSSSTLLLSVVVLAFVQFIVQLYFFMGQEVRQKWNFIILLSTVGLVFIVVMGSIWIMYHLNYNMSPQMMNSIMNNQGGI